MFENLQEGHERFAFPEGIQRVTAGHGGEAILILTGKKTALFDCGMACFGDTLVENIKKALGGRPLDYILMSHTHYDHIGALPWVRKAFPEARTCGSEHGRKVLKRPGALRQIRELGQEAAREYMPEAQVEISVEGLCVDVTVRHGEQIPLGNDQFFSVIETKGHTDCSLTYVLEPMGLMFASESTGIPERKGFVHTAILKDFEDSMEAVRRCRAYHAKNVICPHYGILPEPHAAAYWDLYEKKAREEKAFILNLHREGKSFDEILRIYCDAYWSDERATEQPYAAFAINAEHIVKTLMRESG